jgi:outer membrane protein assembly factor BamB
VSTSEQIAVESPRARAAAGPVGPPPAWNTAGGDPRRTGFSSTAVVPPLTQAWQFNGSGWIESGIVVSGHTAVFADRGGRVFAIDVRDGAMLWDYEMEGTPATPTVMNDRVYAATGGGAACLNLSSGKEIWRSRFGAKANAIGDGAIGSILYAKERLFICARRLVILNAEDGRMAGNMNAEFEPGPHTGACCIGDSVFLPTRKEIRRLNLSTGTVDGSLQLENPVTSGPIVAGNLLMFGTSRSAIEAYDPQTLVPAWVFQVESPVLYQGAGAAVTSRPAFSKGRMFFGGPDGQVYGIKTKTGRRVWKYNTRDQLESPPIVSGRVVYCLCSRGEFVALSSQDGTRLWRFETDRHISHATGAPAVAPDRVLIGWDNLYAFKPSQL